MYDLQVLFFVASCYLFTILTPDISVANSNITAMTNQCSVQFMASLLLSMCHIMYLPPFRVGILQYISPLQSLHLSQEMTVSGATAQYCQPVSYININKSVTFYCETVYVVF